MQAQPLHREFLALGAGQHAGEESRGGGSAIVASTGGNSVLRYRSMVDAHYEFIWRSLRGLGVPAAGVDDAAQQVFLTASKKLELIVEGSERAFLFSTALGVAANARRSLRRRREDFNETALANRADLSPNAERLLELRQSRTLLDRLLEEMPDDQRTVFVLFELEEMTGAEIADLLQLAPGTVASRLRRGRESFHAIAKRLRAAAVNRGGLP